MARPYFKGLLDENIQSQIKGICLELELSLWIMFIFFGTIRPTYDLTSLMQTHKPDQTKININEIMAKCAAQLLYGPVLVPE